MISMVDPSVECPVAPAYREGYPAMKLLGVRTRWREGKRECEWHNEKHELVARIELLAWEDEALDFVCEWIDGTTRRSRREVIDLRRRSTLTRRMNPDALCAGCQSFTPTLYLMDGDWRCAACHHLVPLSTLLSRKEAVLVRARQLQFEVHGRAPPTYGFRTWDQKRIECERLKELVQIAGITEVPEHLRPRVQAGWVENPLDREDPSQLTAIGYRAAEAPITRIAPIVVPRSEGWF